jgi:diaminohydroxyphosphoribosylaminopyrimidine deaminase / 5-amino-6-(5-phosphoribosylamino)uracil reductase
MDSISHSSSPASGATNGFSAFEEAMMREALRLAAGNISLARPNPSVGCVIVQGERIVGAGATQAYGGPHAEQAALLSADAQTRGASVYVTLEPCSAVGASGRHESCCASLIAAGVANVFVATRDANPAIHSQGIAALRAAGIRVVEGLLEDEAQQHHAGFLSRMTRGTPWVRAKMAASLDGRTALSNGQSQWITGEPARADGHAFRARACAVLAGSGTVMTDNPMLNVRHLAVAQQPLRIVLDPRGTLRANLNIIQSSSENAPVLVVNGERINEHLAKTAPQVELLSLPDNNGRIDLHTLLRELGGRKINELHIEAGARLTGAFLQADAVDELLIYLAPTLFGPLANEMFTLPELLELPAAQKWKFFDVKSIGEDVRMRLKKMPR